MVLELVLRSWIPPTSSFMAARRVRGGRGNRMMGDARDKELQALWRQVEELTLRLDRREARSDHGQSHGYSRDEFDVNPFVKAIHKMSH